MPPWLAVMLARVMRMPVSTAAMEVLTGPSLSDATGAAEEFGLTLTPLREGLARSLAPARSTGGSE